MTGKVKYFNSEKGYGFIIGEDGLDYFYHIKEVKDQLLVEYGDEVEFTGTQDNRGLKACNINIIQKHSNVQEKTVHVHHTHKQTDDEDYLAIARYIGQGSTFGSNR